MNYKRFFRAASTALLIVIVIVLGSVPGAWASSYKVLHAFNGTTGGGEPHQHLIFDTAGNLYGVDQVGGDHGAGVVFELSPQPDGSWTQSVLYSFTGGADGSAPAAALVFDAAGNLYSTTWLGGAYGDGVVFKLTHNDNGSWTESVLHDFTGGADGNESWSFLIFDSAGDLFGTAVYGGANGAGIVFELTPNADGTWTENILYTFTGGADGSNPCRGLIFDAAGDLYGTTQNGGAHGYGTVFELVPTQGGGWTETVLHSFRSVDGSAPQAALVFDAAGNLYGTSETGGSYGYGVVFTLRPNSGGTWTEKVLHHFTGGNDGNTPKVGVILDAAGNVYGTTGSGGAHGDGVVFEVTQTPKGGWKEKLLHTFVGYGRDPESDLIFDGAGNIYGATWGGRNNGGLVFEITP